jgi:hypothetical protein
LISLEAIIKSSRGDKRRACTPKCRVTSHRRVDLRDSDCFSRPMRDRNDSLKKKLLVYGKMLFFVIVGYAGLGQKHCPHIC